MKNIDKIVKKCECISFDIFDTLICRQVPNPHEVYSIVEQEYNESHEAPSITNFLQARVSAEQRVSQVNAFYTIDDIYNELKKEYGSEPANELKLLEIETEKQVSYANSFMKEVYDRCVAQGKRVILISDMYLDSITISDILEKNGYSGWQKLFISCECESDKRHGRLYKHVKKILATKGHNICHFGDNLVSDYFMARFNGLKAVRVK